MLGELYKPKGMARETAQAVLEVEEPHACNVAWGCSNGCLYCYGPKVGKESREKWLQVRYPKISPYCSVERQLLKGLKPQGVFLSFMTDPFLPETSTAALIGMLRDKGIRVATLSKLDVSRFHNIRHGITVVSLDHYFHLRYEPNTLPSYTRLKFLKAAKDRGDFVWISMEPYPPSSIHKQNLLQLLEEIKFVDLIVFGKWNYDARAKTEQARQEYAGNLVVVKDFCRSNNIRLHIKSDTIKFVLSPFSSNEKS
jgi:DNA repair photolyase